MIESKEAKSLLWLQCKSEARQVGFPWGKGSGNKNNGRLQEAFVGGDYRIGLGREEGGVKKDAMSCSSWNLAGHNINRHQGYRNIGFWPGVRGPWWGWIMTSKSEEPTEQSCRGVYLGLLDLGDINMWVCK